MTEKDEQAQNQNLSLLYLVNYILDMYHIEDILSIVL
jgi:hypothetical protein